MFSFPDPVNETSARIVAGGVVLMTGLYAMTNWLPLLAIIAYGFWARVLTGPTLSPLGRFATEIATPWLERTGHVTSHRYSSGPPKRFAQGIGTALSSAGLIAHLSGGLEAASVIVVMITAAAFLESAMGFCLGCTIFSYLIRLGLIPEAVCEACADISKRPSALVNNG